MARLSEFQTPENITQEQIDYITTLTSYMERRKYLNFLYKREKMNKKQYEVKMNRVHKDHDEVYNLNNNSLFHRVRSATIKRMENINMLRSMMWSQPFIIDLSLERFMNEHAVGICSRQILKLINQNLQSVDPFSIHICSAASDSSVMKYLNKFTRSRIYDVDYPVNFHRESYMDHFPKHELVYLTNHSNVCMTKYSHDVTYIIPGYIDKKSTGIPYDLAEAKKLGIKTARLPFDLYLR